MSIWLFGYVKDVCLKVSCQKGTGGRLFTFKLLFTPFFLFDLLNPVIDLFFSPAGFVSNHDCRLRQLTTKYQNFPMLKNDQPLSLKLRISQGTVSHLYNSRGDIYFTRQYVHELCRECKSVPKNIHDLSNL